MSRVAPALCAAALASMALARCADPLSDGDPQAVTGAMLVGVTAPNGADSRLTLSGPDGWASSITVGGPDAGTPPAALDGGAGAQLKNLVPGKYTLTAAPIVTPAPIVDTVWLDPRYDGVASTPVSVLAGESTEVAVRDGVRAGSGALWLSRFGDPRLMSGWAGDALLDGGAVTPAWALAHSFDPVLDTAFDARGDLWLLTREATGELVEFPYDSLGGRDGGSAPRVLPAGGGLGCLAFDRSGRLWACRSDGALASWPASALAQDGPLAPDIEVRSRGGGIVAPRALAFDAVGNLWVANGNDTVAKLSPRQLTASGYQVASVVVPVPSPGRMAFDANGTLWIVSGNGVVSLNSASQIESGTHAFGASLSLALQPSALAFDAIGDLWIFGVSTDDGSARLWLFSPGQQVAGGAQAPVEMLRGPPDAGAPSSLAFNPPPAALPLYGSP